MGWAKVKGMTINRLRIITNRTGEPTPETPRGVLPPPPGVISLKPFKAGAHWIDSPLRLHKGLFLKRLLGGCARIVPINEGSVVKRWQPKNRLNRDSFP